MTSELTLENFCSWYPGVICTQLNGRYRIKFDDGDVAELCTSRIQASNTPALHAAKLCTLMNAEMAPKTALSKIKCKYCGRKDFEKGPRGGKPLTVQYILYILHISLYIMYT